MEQEVFPEWVWQFYSNVQFGEDLLVTRVQGREVSFSTAAPEVFASEANYKRYTELFHRRDLIVGRRFSLFTLTATGLEFEDKLLQCGLRSLAAIEQEVFPEWVWQFYSNAQFSENLLYTRV